MSRAQIIRLLEQHQEHMRQQFAVRALALFGSVARDEMREGSDVDILVEFDGPATFDHYMDLKFFLEGLLGTKVDLVTREAVKPRMMPIVERDLVRVA